MNIVRHGYTQRCWLGDPKEIQKVGDPKEKKKKNGIFFILDVSTFIGSEKIP